MLLVLGPERREDLVRHLGGGLPNSHGLESALQGGVLLDVAAVLLHGRGANALHLPARERRLEELRGVHARVLPRGPRAHERVQLVYEENDPRVRNHLLDHLLEALLELPAVLGVGDQHTHLQREEPLALQPGGHLLVHDHLREPLRQGRLAHARVAHEAGVALAPPYEDAQHAPHLLVAADTGVQLALARHGCEVHRALGEHGLLLGGPPHGLAGPHEVLLLVLGPVAELLLQGAGVLAQGRDHSLPSAALVPCDGRRDVEGGDGVIRGLEPRRMKDRERLRGAGGGGRGSAEAEWVGLRV
mmetsp:Transcript_45742/g.145763  ORF Transcript_45742/g.145763 Transcript_45742/m.145763 type:complete len:302 (+) Transcript_45742:1379-2284(+)